MASYQITNGERAAEHPNAIGEHTKRRWHRVPPYELSRAMTSSAFDTSRELASRGTFLLTRTALKEPVTRVPQF